MITMTQITYSEAEAFVRHAAGEMDIGGFMVPAINAPVILLDDLKELMLKGDAPFAVLYWDEPEGRMFALFTDSGEVNVGEIASAYGGNGEKTLAVFKTPPQKEMSGEMIPLMLEFPPDDLDVLVLYFNQTSQTTFVRQGHHVSDGQFDVEDADEIIAWSYMPEIPNSLDMLTTQ